MPESNFVSYIMVETYYILMWWWDVRSVLNQQMYLDFYTTSSLKQQSMGRNVPPLGHNILIPSQPVIALTPKCCLFSREAANTNIIVLGLTWPGLEPTIYHTQSEHANHYTTAAVYIYSEDSCIRCTILRYKWLYIYNRKKTCF